MLEERSVAPTGLARRGRRLSDQETERRMLESAVTMINREGLTVSLDHISFEDVIRDADVSRSAVYRRWPYKDLFFSDLVVELARDATATIVDDEVALMRQVLREHPAWLDTSESRHRVMTELIRRLALFDFLTMHESPGWRTYLALHATVAGLTEGELRDRVQQALAKSEQARTARIARSWEQLAGLFGYRLRPEIGATFEVMATMLNATMRGLVIAAPSTPDIVTVRMRGGVFGAADSDEWSLAAIGIASVASGFLEPDPDIEWDDARLTSVKEELRSWVAPPADDEAQVD